MDTIDIKRLHEAIEDGDMEVVRELLDTQAEGQYFSYEDSSALYKALYCERYEIASYLIRKGARIDEYDANEVRYTFRNRDTPLDLTRLNLLLAEYNRKSSKSCVFQLISWSQSPQGLDGERLQAVSTMYETFFQSEYIQLLMKVLEKEPFDIVYDFESDDVSRLHRLSVDELEVFGLTLTLSKEIFVGAKNLLSPNSRKRAVVYGVVAEELCHLALTTVFQNNAKPYKEEDSELIEEFQSIVRDVRSLTYRSCHVERVVRNVFSDYEHYAWDCELIARIPHIIGIFGEDLGKMILSESSELKNLLKFYEQNVITKCRMFIDASLSSKQQRLVEGLKENINFISFMEKQIPPLIDTFPSFREYLVQEDGFSLMVTTCVKISTLQVFHELKSE